ncbi:DUF4352 domain-containing protein [Planobispora rosea]|uniref:DUF4352 domain-containing protein n=1 Tax=Planobispora rosea TaxID=35762 RepID=UPI00083A486E|nr:DUF4352 domain-containing protein [Planobispora rosea]
MPRPAVPAGLAFLLALSLGGCTQQEAASGGPSPRPSPTYELPPRPVRPGEIPVSAAPVQDGEIRFQVIGLQKGLDGFFGSHAEWKAKGQYVVVRIVTENAGRTNARFDATEQKLLTSGGTAYRIDKFTQATKRQPETFLLGAGVRIEMDLWFDIPDGAEATGIQLFGSPPLGFRTTPGTTVPLP